MNLLPRPTSRSLQRAVSFVRSSPFAWLAGFSILIACAPAAAFAQNQITISPSTLPNTFVGQTYSQQLTATGGTGTINFVVTAGSLPTGLTLATNGALTGTATAAGSFIFLVTANDQANGAVSQGYTIVVQGPPTVTTPTVANVSAGSATLGGTVTNDGGLPLTARGVVYALTNVNPNPSLGGTGVGNAAVTGGSTGAFTVNVTGLAQGSGYTFKAYATNGAGTVYTSTATFTTNTLTFAPLLLRNPQIGSEYVQSLSVNGGSAPYTFTVTAGALPPGITLSSTGILNGTPTVDGNFTFAVTATDAGGATITQSYVVTIAPPVVITTTVLPDSNANVGGYFFLIQATGGTGTKSFVVTEGSLPIGLSMDSSGAITGTPTFNGTYNFTVSATDTVGATASKSFTIVIGGVVTINTSTLADGTVNQTNYNQLVRASGGQGLKSFSVTTGSLPPGLSLSNEGVLSGTPTTAGSYTFTVTATDVLGVTATRSFTININPALVVSTTTLPVMTLNLPFSQTIAATGGTGARTFTVSSGTLPTGLSLSSNGVLSGTPTVAGTYSFTVTVSDTVGATTVQSYSVVAGGPITISPDSLTAPVINVAGYSATFSATGGNGAKTFSVTSGSLPTGLTLTSGGVLSGTVTAAGTYTFTVTATDAASATASRSYTVVVAPPVNIAQTITFGSLPNRLASDGSFNLSATSSSGLPVTFTVTGPATLSGSTVTLTGAPGVVTVTATQAGNTTYSPATSVVQNFTVTVATRLANLSSRVRIASDAAHQLITGFVIGGQQPKRVLVRAIGPSLTGFGVTGALVNPSLQIFDSAGRSVLQNDDWSGTETSSAAAQVGAFSLAVGTKDAAVVTTLAPGAYTMQITAGTETGIGLAEVYDASLNPGAEAQHLVNISTRGFVDTGDGVLIGGFNISGTTPKRVLIRGIGPGLAGFGVAGALADPRLTVFGGTIVVAQNDDWSTPTTVIGQQTAASAAELSSAAAAVAAFSLGANSKDAAVLVTLGPGSYTAQVAGAGTTTGVALVEVYEVP